MPEPLQVSSGWPTADQLGLSARDAYFPALIRDRSKRLASDRDAWCRGLLRERLPGPLHFLIDRPWAIRVLLRIWPSWRPQTRELDLSRNGTLMTEGTAAYMARCWVIEHPDETGNATYEGLIVRYRDVHGLPMEIDRSCFDCEHAGDPESFTAPPPVVRRGRPRLIAVEDFARRLGEVARWGYKVSDFGRRDAEEAHRCRGRRGGSDGADN